LKDSWAEPDIRDEVVDYVCYCSSRTEIKAGKIVNHIGITRSKYYDWRHRYGKINEHNAWIPRDFYLTDRQKRAFYYLCSILDGFSRYIAHWEIRESMTEADVTGRCQRLGNGFCGPLQ